MDLNSRIPLTLTRFDDNALRVFIAEFKKELRSIIEKSAKLEHKRDVWYEIYMSENDIWSDLEQIAIQGVIDGGIKAMAYYRQAWGVVESDKPEDNNPTTNADLEATIAILRSIDLQLDSLAASINVTEVSYLGEETVYSDVVENKVAKNLSGKIKDTRVFFKNTDNQIRVIIDAIDGTSNFARGFPLFCSALAIFIEDQLRVSAIYDPVHHVVYSGVLSGPKSRPLDQKSAFAWHVSMGDRENLVEKKRHIFNKPDTGCGHPFTSDEIPH